MRKQLLLTSNLRLLLNSNFKRDFSLSLIFFEKETIVEGIYNDERHFDNVIQYAESVYFDSFNSFLLILNYSLGMLKHMELSCGASVSAACNACSAAERKEKKNKTKKIGKMNSQRSHVPDSVVKSSYCYSLV
jgi:hypothetical protein